MERRKYFSMFFHSRFSLSSPKNATLPPLIKKFPLAFHSRSINGVQQQKFCSTINRNCNSCDVLSYYSKLGQQFRKVMVSAKNVPDSSLPLAMDGHLKVHRRIVDGLDGDSSQPQAPPVGGKVSTRLLVPATQAGSLIGKQGAIVHSIQEAANCIFRVLGQGDLPVFALQDDRVVEVVGEDADAQKDIEVIASH